MYWKSLSRILAGTCLAICFLWRAGIAADKPEANCEKCQPDNAQLPKATAELQKGPPVGNGRDKKDNAFFKDRDTFHFLLENHKSIKRTVKKLDNGVETVTESENPMVAKRIQEHVPAMYERLKSGNGVRYWDPLFAEAFKHGKKMKLLIENTKSGVKIVETSEEVEVVKIIQAHAEVVSKFVQNGFEEAHKEHPLPATKK